MGDFSQNGIITTLHNLSQRSLEDLERELCEFSDKRPMALILPCLYSELQTDAMPNIINHLKKVPYLSEIIIGLDRATEEEYRHALQFFSELPQKHHVLWNDGPRLKDIDEKLKNEGLSPCDPGKGRNVWFCMGYTLGATNAEAIAMHDCDIVTYDRSLLARLIYPVANPNFNYEFCKGYYSRVANGKMNGRVNRLLVAPLLFSLKKVLGHNDYLNYLDSFRYALAGEFSFRRDVMTDIRIPCDWGLEVGVLSEMYRNFANNRLCQVDIADAYDHKHQDLSADDEDAGLSKMSIDISKAIFRKLATNGVVFDQETFRTIKATYYRAALDFIEMYHNDAEINGLKLDVHSEEKAVELFASNLMKAGTNYLDNTIAAPFIPRWNRIESAFPEVMQQMQQAVAEDMAEFGPNA
ncbi:glycosyl transferase [Marinomonas ostreistagni]|uniref:glycosyl transferase n=1 Tax=Marinomonas ostreistagni TaxID=359209 RepID=UPI001950ECE4|nr:glycosyl transferase [Marinomonas ostreistagni]MBM6551963.1 glycosyl transferase [Marinomonas ostreistagni]